jgi:predicted Zn-dependent peptidase
MVGVAVACAVASWAPGEMHAMQLQNGGRLIVKPNRSNKILAIHCFFRVGPYYERNEQAGITNFVCRTMLKGTRKRSALEIPETMEAIGGSIDASASADFAEVATISTVDDLDVALDVLSDVIVNPTFPPEEVEKERTAILAAIRQQEDSSFSYTYRNFLELVYSGHPYAKAVLGTSTTVQAIQRRQIVDFHRENFVANQMLIVIVGDVDPARIAKRIDRAFAGLAPGRPEQMSVSKRFRPRGRDKRLTKDIEQAFIIVGFVTVPATHEDYVPLKVASAVLGTGGSLSSRLFVRLRDRRGLAYAVGSAMPTRADKSHFFAYIGTGPGSVDAAREGLLGELRSLATEPLPDDELERAKTHLVSQFRFAHQRNTNQAAHLGLYELVGLGAAYDEHYCDLVKQVTAEQVKAVAAKYFRRPATAVILEPSDTKAAETVGVAP